MERCPQLYGNPSLQTNCPRPQCDRGPARDGHSRPDRHRALGSEDLRPAHRLVGEHEIGRTVNGDGEGLEEPAVVGAPVGEGVGVGIDLHQRAFQRSARVVLQHLDLDLLRACGRRAEQQGGSEDKNVLRE